MADLAKDLAQVETKLREQWQDMRRRWDEIFVEVHAARQAASVGDDAEAVRRIEAAEHAYVVATLGTADAPLEPCDLLFALHPEADRG